jgi:hypothetical protein
MIEEITDHYYLAIIFEEDKRSELVREVDVQPRFKSP